MIRKLMLACLLLSLAPTVFAQSVNRGPYLQTQTANTIIVRWRTDVATDSVVRYGTDSASLNQVITVSGSRTEHAVTVSALSPVTQYWYSVGDSGGPLSSDASHHFLTAPVTGTASDTRVWVIGDSGTANASARAVRDAYKAWSASNPADLWIMLGDNAYNDGTDAEYQAAVFDTYPELLRQLPLWPTLGNHDGHTADSANQSGPYYDIFDLPTAGEAGGLSSGTEAYYSFDYGNIHFVCLDSYETDRSPGGNMLLWLESDLATNTLPWVIAFWHHPPYTKGSHDSDTEGQLIDMRQNALPILEAWGVDLVMSGHSHSYERSYLLDDHYGNSSSLDPVNEVLDPGDGRPGGDGAYEKPDLVAAEHAGAVYAVAGSSGKISSGSLNHPAMFVSLMELGSMVIDVAGNQLDAVFIDDAGLVRDSFTMVKTPDIEPPLISGVSAEDANHVLVSFSEGLDAATATDPVNYVIAGLTVNVADLQPDNRTVRLTTGTMTQGLTYNLTVDNVEDVAGNVILPGSQAMFSYVETVVVAFQDGLAPTPVYDGTGDATIKQATPDTIYGLAATLEADGDDPSGSSQDMNILLRWDVGAIPATATVESASIGLGVTNISSGAYQCHALLAAWNQAEATWNQASAGVPWGAPGASSIADRGTEVLCTVTAGTTGTLSVPLNTAGIALVQSWVSGASANHGLVIANGATTDGADFHSSESGTAMSRPRLEVTYSTPVDPPNQPPQAAFNSNCADLACNFTDTSTDSDGTLTGWSWDFGDGNGSNAQNPSHSYTADGTYTVTLTVTDDDGATGVDSRDLTVSGPSGPVDHAATADVPGVGSVSGTYLGTQSDDEVTQSVREVESGGKKSRRRSLLEHTWRFELVPGAAATVEANAWSSGSSDGDAFVFSFSSDGAQFTDLFTVSSTDPANLQSAVIAGPVSGTVFVRVRDTDRGQGNRALDTVIIDHLVIRTEAGGGNPPTAPDGLAAAASGPFGIDLDWNDQSDDELGFEIERSTDNVTWDPAGSVGANATSFSDDGLQPETQYWFRVRSFNVAGGSAWSASQTATTHGAPDISLSLGGRKQKGKHLVDLTWSGAAGGGVDILRDGNFLLNTANDGAYTDSTGNKGARTYTYQVCETGTSVCSAVESVTF